MKLVSVNIINILYYKYLCKYMPQVSIITPCYNSSEFLEETIQSVLNQTFTDWEWTVSYTHLDVYKRQDLQRNFL